MLRPAIFLSHRSIAPIYRASRQALIAYGVRIGVTTILRSILVGGLTYIGRDDDLYRSQHHSI
ncbi:hypothetical protein HMPREF3185_01168 [Porphyromonas somerae]|uniref:Uncharacterized protein n=1 Tax=Porphyromonas somerae TaxID=322095 RepID=A0A134B816_9PORP|nr:hypothetical protein HMPREF3184_01168 [Porphyromonadaceae bacterium KA00676]KXB76079.1 hypothetical protein HMPREF3185_01168 [Porphyromonas somerae]